jgi:tetratricopeptide (TPR) repeat protein
MTEGQYIQRLKDLWPRDTDASLEAIALADTSVSAFHGSARLWCMRGSLIQLGPEQCPHPLDEALASYRRAVELDPEFAEAWEELGHYYDAVLDDESGAEPFFERARKLRERKAEPGAPPNGGPATPFGSSGVTEGPPSVS